MNYVCLLTFNWIFFLGQIKCFRILMLNVIVLLHIGIAEMKLYIFFIKFTKLLDLEKIQVKRKS